MVVASSHQVVVCASDHLYGGITCAENARWPLPVPTGLSDISNVVAMRRVLICWLPDPLSPESGHWRHFAGVNNSTSSIWCRLSPLCPADRGAHAARAPFFDPLECLLILAEDQLHAQSGLACKADIALMPKCPLMTQSGQLAYARNAAKNY